MVSLTAAATGTLERTPLCQLMVYVLQRQLSGTLVFEAPNGEKSALSFDGGRIVKARTGSGTLRLGQLLLERGAISVRDLDRAMGERQKQFLGERLQRLERVDQQALDTVLDEQVYLIVEAIAAGPAQTAYGYYPDRDMLANWGREPRKLDSLRAIGRAFAKAPPNPAQIDAIMATLSFKVLRLHPQSRVGRFGFDHAESAVLDVLRAKPQTFAELAETGLLPLERLRPLLALLAMTHHLDVGAGWPIDVAPRRSSLRAAVRLTPRSRPGVSLPDAPAKGASGEVDRGQSGPCRSEICRRAEIVQNQTYYEVLGVEPPVDSGVVQAAFLQLAKRWHPDKLPAELQDLKPLVNRVFARMAEAHQVLSDSNSRADYERHLQDPSTAEDEQQVVERALLAVSAFQRAEVYARKGDWASAERSARQAMEADPEQPEYGALWAWVVTKSGQRVPGESMDDLLELLNRAVRQVKDNVRVRLYRAQVLKWVGRVPEAMRDYRAVVELEPNHIEAQRELRLYRMRNESSGSLGQEGLLGKLFKK